MKKRKKFANRVLKTLPKHFWTEGVSFYFDGVGFAHKTNPADKARSTPTVTWRKPQEGLSRTTKGKKEESGGHMAHFIVAIAYGKGVISCEQYFGTLTGGSFGELVHQCFPAIFENSSNPCVKLFLQDSDPRQVSMAAHCAMDDVGCRMFAIPPRSPDINPIENTFHLVKRQLSPNAIEQNITKENYEQFSVRVRNTILNFPKESIDATIESMEKRMRLIVKTKGNRTKY